MAMLPIASQRRSPVISARRDPDEREHQSPMSAPVSSRSTTGSSGFFVVWMNRHHERSPRDGSDLADARCAARGLRGTIAIAEHRVRDCGRFESAAGGRASRRLRRARTATPSVNSTSATTNAQKYRSRPKPNGCSARRRLAAATPAEEQQPLVAGVGDRVDRLGEHRRRPGDSEGDELRDRDAEVREERGDDRAPGRVLEWCAQPDVDLRCQGSTSQTAVVGIARRGPVGHRQSHRRTAGLVAGERARALDGRRRAMVSVHGEHARPARGGAARPSRSGGGRRDRGEAAGRRARAARRYDGGEQRRPARRRRTRSVASSSTRANVRAVVRQPGVDAERPVHELVQHHALRAVAARERDRGPAVVLFAVERLARAVAGAEAGTSVERRVGEARRATTACRRRARRSAAHASRPGSGLDGSGVSAR